MKKVLTALLLLLCLLPLFGQSIEYVYRNTLSTTDLENPVRGAVYTDNQGSIFIVHSVHEGAAMLDRTYTARSVGQGTELYRRGSLKTLTVSGNTDHIKAVFSFTGPLYPLRPTIAAGYSLYAKAPFFLGGVTLEIPMSRVFSTNFTLVEDACLTGYALAGVMTASGSTGLEVQYGLEYRHTLGHFVWGVGAEWAYSRSNAAYRGVVGVTLALGVRL